LHQQQNLDQTIIAKFQSDILLNLAHTIAHFLAVCNSTNTQHMRRFNSF